MYLSPSTNILSLGEDRPLLFAQISAQQEPSFISERPSQRAMVASYQPSTLM